MHSSNSLAAFNLSLAERFSLGSNTPVFMASPLGHSVGTIHGARLWLFFGAPLVLQKIWEPRAALSMIEEYQCAFTAAATPFLKDLLDVQRKSSTRKLATMKVFLCGGAQVPPSLIRQAREAFPQTFITVLWGMTEGGMTTCVPDESSFNKMQHTAGLLTMGFELRILGKQDQVLEPGEEGELAVRGPCMFIGYYGQDEFHRAQLTKDGFFRTGDLAILDNEGYLQITGRLKDLIIRAGVNISPVPAEDILAGQKEIKNVAVVGFPDDRLGERICAVVCSDNQELWLEDLTAFSRQRGLPKHLFAGKSHTYT